jgi:F0F1-type ATP synthase assembly protein I
MKIRPTVRPASRGADEGWAVLSTLISGFVVFGGIGWLLDQWWGTRLMTPIGLVVGMSLGIYAVVMQFGRPRATPEVVAATPATDEAAALRAAKAMNRARAVKKASPASPVHSPDDGPPPASTRRETECL